VLSSSLWQLPSAKLLDNVWVLLSVINSAVTEGLALVPAAPLHRAVLAITLLLQQVQRCRLLLPAPDPAADEDSSSSSSQNSKPHISYFQVLI
jgi:hypothetical protein